MIAYLEKMRQQFEEQRIQIKEQIHACENKRVENDKFITILEDSNDPNYEAFSPRQVNTFNRRKIVELQEEQKALADDLLQLHEQLKEMDEKLAEITAVIRDAKEKFARTIKEPELLSLAYHMDLCEKLFDEDPVLSKQELVEMSKIISGMLQDMGLSDATSSEEA